MRISTSLSIPTLLLVISGVLSAQAYSGDARKIAMGGAGYSENLATKLIEDDKPYRSIVIPLGLIQALKDRNRFNPDDNHFDPVFAAEYIANPLHFVIGRDPGGNRGQFVQDAVNGEISRDLNAYRGFTPTSKLVAEGLASPNWGKTIRFAKRPDGGFQGIYIGVGPYLSARTVLNIDPGLIGVLASTTPVAASALANHSYTISSQSVGQLAMAVTGGYRARFTLPGKKGKHAIYAGANYNYLRGFNYEAPDIRIRFDTDQAGLITLNPTTAPAVVDRVFAHHGTGYAIDLGLSAVLDRLQLGFGANGLANRIVWENPSLQRYSLQSLVQGGEFIKEHPASPASKIRVELPVDYTGSAAYNWDKISVVAEGARGFQGTRFHGGVEYRLGPIEFRGGAGYGLERWHPAGGIGFNLGPKVSVDVAAFGSTTNIERQLRPAIAVSLRFNRLRG